MHSRRKGLTCLHVHTTVHQWGNLKEGPELQTVDEILTGGFLLACSGRFLRQPRLTELETVPSNGWCLIIC